MRFAIKVDPLPDHWRDLLSRRQREIALLLCGGATRHEVASSVGISVKSADSHRSNIFLALGVYSEVELLLDLLAPPMGQTRIGGSEWLWRTEELTRRTEECRRCAVRRRRGDAGPCESCVLRQRAVEAQTP